MKDQLSPYFNNGLLFIPQKALHALQSVGLEWRVSHQAVRGIPLDDEESLEEIERAVEVLLHHINPSNPLYEALSSSDTRFMLAGKPSQS